MKRVFVKRFELCYGNISVIKEVITDKTITVAEARKRLKKKYPDFKKINYLKSNRSQKF